VGIFIVVVAIYWRNKWGDLARLWMYTLDGETRCLEQRSSLILWE
jgi:hypothetical protein